MRENETQLEIGWKKNVIQFYLDTIHNSCLRLLDIVVKNPTILERNFKNKSPYEQSQEGKTPF